MPKKWYEHIWPFNIYYDRREWHSLFLQSDKLLDKKSVANATLTGKNARLQGDMRVMLEWASKNGVSLTHKYSEGQKPIQLAYSTSLPTISVVSGPTGELKSPVIEYIYSNPVAVRYQLPAPLSEFSTSYLREMLINDVVNRVTEDMHQSLKQGFDIK